VKALITWQLADNYSFYTADARHKNPQAKRLPRPLPFDDAMQAKPLTSATCACVPDSRGAGRLNSSTGNLSCCSLLLWGVEEHKRYVVVAVPNSLRAAPLVVPSPTRGEGAAFTSCRSRTPSPEERICISHRKHRRVNRSAGGDVHHKHQ